MNCINLISIIIPIYNVEQYLRQCLDSVVNQTYKNLEIILIDDGSTDNSGKICNEYALKDNRIKVIHKENGGVSSARNSGLNVAKGDYIGFVDGDDIISRDMYEVLLNTMIETNSQLVVCNWFKEKENNWVENKNFPKEQILTTNEALESFWWCMYCWNKLFDRKILKFIRFSETCGFGEDTLYCLNVLQNLKKVICINQAKYYYRVNQNSASRSRKFKKSYLESLNIIDIEIQYANKNNLKELSYKLYKSKLTMSSTFLGYIVSDDVPDIDSATKLLNFIKKNFLYFLLKTKVKIWKKCFVVIACINLNLAIKIYKLIYKRRNS